MSNPPTNYITLNQNTQQYQDLINIFAIGNSGYTTGYIANGTFNNGSGTITNPDLGSIFASNSGSGPTISYNTEYIVNNGTTIINEDLAALFEAPPPFTQSNGTVNYSGGYYYIAFTNTGATGSITFTHNINNVNVVVVGGGGGGGGGSNNSGGNQGGCGGGGGGGGIYQNSFDVSQYDSFTSISIGGGGSYGGNAPGTNSAGSPGGTGGTSSLTYNGNVYSAEGGGEVVLLLIYVINFTKEELVALVEVVVVVVAVEEMVVVIIPVLQA